MEKKVDYVLRWDNRFERDCEKAFDSEEKAEEEIYRMAQDNRFEEKRGVWNLKMYKRTYELVLSENKDNEIRFLK